MGRVGRVERVGRVGAYPGSFNPLTVAHLAIAETARVRCRLDQVDLIVSKVALDKEQVEHPRLEHRLAVLRRVGGRLRWLGLVVTEAQLVADMAQGYDVVVLGADKWAQLADPRFYGGSTVARDEALARLPEVAVVPRPPHRSPESDDRVRVLVVPEASGVSSTAARAGQRDWMAADAAAFDHETGAWSDADRYRRWLERESSRAAGSAGGDGG